MEATLGLDFGNKTAKGVLMNERLIDSIYIQNFGVIESLKKIFSKLRKNKVKIIGCGVTGASRKFLAKLVNADIVKTEILGHSVGILKYFPKTRFAIELGGEDSKLLEFRNGIFSDFQFNTLCSAGCGAYLDNIAFRFGIEIDKFDKIALKSKNPTNISSKCSVFGTSAALSKLHNGISKEDILMGVCYGLARNYLTMLAKGKKLVPPVIFAGGVSRNKAVKKAMEDILNCEILTHPFGHLTGAIGMAILARKVKNTRFKSFEVADKNYNTKVFYCKDCSNSCEVIEVKCNNKTISHLGSKCGKYE